MKHPSLLIPHLLSAEHIANLHRLGESVHNRSKFLAWENVLLSSSTCGLLSYALNLSMFPTLHVLFLNTN